MQGSGFRVQGVGIMDERLWCMFYGLGFRVQDVGLRVQGVGFRVQGLRFRV